MMAALASQQLSGWRATAYTVAGGAAWLGCLSVAYTTDAGGLVVRGGWPRSSSPHCSSSRP
jgi:hypothetical protein